MAHLVGRQTQAVVSQAQEFADAVRAALAAATRALEGLDAEVRSEVARRFDSIFDQLALHERMAARWQGVHDQLTGRVEELARRVEQLESVGQQVHFAPWYQSGRFEERFRGTHAEMLERYRDVAAKLVDSGPVLDFGCGRGEMLELLAELGIPAFGVEVDVDLVKAVAERGFNVEHGDGVRFLADLPDGSLGALALIQVVEHLSAQDVLGVVSLAARKVRPGGKVLVETVNPQSLYVYAHAFYLDPTHLRPVHPAYLSFLFEEAGFASVALEWRSPPPADDVLEEIPTTRKSDAAVNANVRRLNELLFAPQDYLIVATR
jgi:O-antigen chain-terminating methyltransferase